MKARLTDLWDGACGLLSSPWLVVRHFLRRNKPLRGAL